MAWRLAPTLVVLRSEINDRWPIRDKTSDGSLGNTSHAAGTSDHNPDSRGVVCAIDIDEDVNRRASEYPSFHAGQPLNELLGELLASAKAGKLPQLRYIIYEGYIYSRTYGFRKQKYEGANLHDHHMHISVSHAPQLADSKKTWGIFVALSSEDKTWIKSAIRDAIIDLVPTAVENADAVLTRDGKIRNIWDREGAGDFTSLASSQEELGKQLGAKP